LVERLESLIANGKSLPMTRNAIIDRDVFIPRGAVIGYDLEEDRKRHAVTERGVVVVTSNDEPFIAQPPGDAQQLEQEADSRGTGRPAR